MKESHETFDGRGIVLTRGGAIPSYSSSYKVMLKKGDSDSNDVVSVSVRTDRENVVDSMDIDASSITNSNPAVKSPLAQQE